MNKQSETTIDDVLMAVNDLATLMGDQLEEVRNEIKDSQAETNEHFRDVGLRFDSMDTELRSVRREQLEMREWLERIDNRFVGFETDIMEIYDRIIVLEEKSTQLTPNEYQELTTKLAAMIAWAQDVSKKTGVPLPKL